MTFAYTDKAAATLNRQLIARYGRLKSLLSFDELNVLNEVNTVCRELYGIIRKTFVRLANRVYRDALRDGVLRDLDEEWVDAILNGYDPVSKYVFSHEYDRRRARLIESILASNDRAREIDAALRGMSFMCRVYADRITDEAVMRAYTDEGENYVRWVAERDGKTCPVCRKRDGRIYEIHAVPADPHPNCRCRRERA